MGLYGAGGLPGGVGLGLQQAEETFPSLDECLPGHRPWLGVGFGDEVGAFSAPFRGRVVLRRCCDAAAAPGFESNPLQRTPDGSAAHRTTAGIHDITWGRVTPFERRKAL